MRSNPRGLSTISELIEPLTLSQIDLIAFAVRDGDATGEDAKRLMAHFCDLVESGKPVPQRLLEHFNEAFKAYLHGTKKIEAALGLVRKKGRPPVDQKHNVEMAAEVLRLRLDGTTYEVAVEETAQKFSCSETTVRQALRGNRMVALDCVVIEREKQRRKFTDEEKARLRKIFHDMPRIDRFGKIAD
jgi:hypothetical protein